MELSDRVNQIEESGTVQFTLLLQQMRKAGREVIDLAVGEPPYDTPADVIEATSQALQQGRTKYGAVAGLHELKLRLAQQFEGWDDRNIIISNGSKQCLYTMFQCIVDPLEEMYSTSDLIFRADIIIYYVRDDLEHPKLMRRNLGNNELPQVVAEHIDNLQFR